MREKIIIAYRDVINFLNNKKKKLYYVCSFTFANKIQVSIVILNIYSEQTTLVLLQYITVKLM